MGKWWEELWSDTKKDFQKEVRSWAVKGAFGLALAGFAWVVGQMTWYSFLSLAFFTILGVFTGTKVVQDVLRKSRGRGSRKEKTSAEQEADRRKRIRKLFQTLIDEANEGEDWGERQFGQWVSRVEHAMLPLVREEVAEFRELFGDWKMTTVLSIPKPLMPSVDQKRRECLVWLEAMLYKYWL